MAVQKTLMVFDFDHTVVEDNTDLEVLDMYPHPLPEDVKKLYCDSDGWTDYMAAIFALLHGIGVTHDEIKNKVLAIALVDGMKDLFDHLGSESYEVIIISDANTIFIDWLLTKYGMKKHVHHVYSNPSGFNAEGKLTIQPYHQQDWCNMSSKNMCKGYIMENHVKERKSQGIEFNRVCYIGDGNNDFCPTLRLAESDYVFARDNFRLQKRIQANRSEVKANVIVWKDASIILETIKSLEK